MSQEKIDDDNDVKIIFEDKIDYPHFQSELIKEYEQSKIEEDDIRIIIEQYNDRKFRLDIAKEHKEILNMPNDGSLTYYVTVLISLYKISYKQWLYSQNKK